MIESGEILSKNFQKKSHIKAIHFIYSPYSLRIAIIKALQTSQQLIPIIVFRFGYENLQAKSYFYAQLQEYDFRPSNRCSLTNLVIVQHNLENMGRAEEFSKMSLLIIFEDQGKEASNLTFLLISAKHLIKNNLSHNFSKRWPVFLQEKQSIIQTIENMSILSLKGSEIKFATFKSKISNNHYSSKSPAVGPLVKVLEQRNAVIDWIYRAQRALSFSKSSLFLGIALLDKLLINGMPLNSSNYQLIGGTLTLLITKFNEVYPVTVRALQALSNQSIDFDDYVESQESFLETLEFDLSPEDPVYENLAELEFRLGKSSEEIIRTAVCNPAVAFRLGEAALIGAIESMFNGGLTERKNDSKLAKQIAELRSELQRLTSRSPANKRLVSPKRA